MRKSNGHTTELYFDEQLKLYVGYERDELGQSSNSYCGSKEFVLKEFLRRLPIYLRAQK